VGGVVTAASTGQFSFVYFFLLLFSFLVAHAHALHFFPSSSALLHFGIGDTIFIISSNLPRLFIVFPSVGDWFRAGGLVDFGSVQVVRVLVLVLVHHHRHHHHHSSPFTESSFSWESGVPFMSFIPGFVPSSSSLLLLPSGVGEHVMGIAAGFSFFFYTKQHLSGL